jgi:hypothetical protein
MTAPRSAPTAALILALSAASAPGPAGETRPLFADVTERTGISFVESCGSREKDWILEVNGSGVALFDADGDGDLDIYFVNSSLLDLKPGDPRPRNALYRNEGGWTFDDITDASGTGDEGWGSGASVADLDNDGHLDIHVTNWGPDVLFRGLGDGRFERMAGTGAEDPLWGISSCMADFDLDGRIDIFVANYVDFEFNPKKKRGAPECVYKGVPVFCGPGGLKPSPDSLYLNAGGWRFRDASEAWGVREGIPGFGMGSLVVDVNRDGYPDVLVANDTNPNFCFVNLKGAKFAEAGAYLGLAYNDYGVAQASMGLASGDIRGIGRDDIVVTNYEDDTCTLHLADEGGLYSDATYPSGIGEATYRYMSWAALLLDVEGDGDLDLFIANGHLAPQMEGCRSSSGYRQPNQLFLNDGTGKFAERPDGLPRGGPRRSARGAASGDLDGDGDPDIVANNIDDPPAVLENLSSGASWLEVRLRGTRSNRAAIGARVSIRAGGRRQERTLQSGMSYASQCEISARFGLAGARDVEEIKVEWPSGLVERFRPPPAGARRIDLVEGTGMAVPGRAPAGR